MHRESRGVDDDPFGPNHDSLGRCKARHRLSKCSLVLDSKRIKSRRNAVTRRDRVCATWDIPTLYLLNRGWRRIRSYWVIQGALKIASWWGSSWSISVEIVSNGRRSNKCSQNDDSVFHFNLLQNGGGQRQRADFHAFCSLATADVERFSTWAQEFYNTKSSVPVQRATPKSRSAGSHIGSPRRGS